MNIIIAFSSRLPQQGKDTAVEYLRKQYNFKRIAFADKLKELCEAGGWNGIKDEKGRGLLIDVGMAFRKYNENTWVDLAIKDAKKIIKEGYPVAISDCRFLNEVKHLKEEFTRTKVIHIGITSNEIGDDSVENDSSQIDFHSMKCDYYICTTKNKDDLYRALDTIIEKINKGEE